MKRIFNDWQRLWAVISLVLLILMAFTLASSAWPRHDPHIVADLMAPACSGWKELPTGFFPERQPEPSAECFFLQTFLFEEQVNIKSPSEYDRYLKNARAKVLGYGFLSWVAMCLLLYVIGSLAGWVGKGLSKRPSDSGE